MGRTLIVTVSALFLMANVGFSQAVRQQVRFVAPPPIVYYYYASPTVAPVAGGLPAIAYYQLPAFVVPAQPLPLRPRRIERHYFSASAETPRRRVPINSTQPGTAGTQHGRGGLIVREYYYISTRPPTQPASRADRSAAPAEKLPIKEPNEAFRNETDKNK